MNARAIFACALICIIGGCQKTGGIDAARENARSAHKSLMVEFGADWCSDCQELAQELHREPLKTCLQGNVNTLHVDVGEFNRNLDVASTLGLDIKNGVIPTAVFFPVANDQRITKVGTGEILSFLKQSCSDGISN